MGNFDHRGEGRSSSGKNDTTISSPSDGELSSDFEDKLKSILSDLYDDEKRFPNPDEIANVERFKIGQIGNLFCARVKSLYDGDTFDVVFSFRKKLDAFTVRLYGVDCPELKPLRRNFESEEKRLLEKARGLSAKKFVSDLILGEKVIVEIAGKDKYGRLLASIYFKLKEDGEMVNLAQYVIDNGHGYEYLGGKKK